MVDAGYTLSRAAVNATALENQAAFLQLGNESCLLTPALRCR